MTEIFKYAFMQNAALSGIFLGALLAYIGIFIVLKKMSFFGDGIAHASLASRRRHAITRQSGRGNDRRGCFRCNYLLTRRFGSSRCRHRHYFYLWHGARSVLVNFTSDLEQKYLLSFW